MIESKWAASQRLGELGRLALANGSCPTEVPLQLPFRHTLLEYMMGKLDIRIARSWLPKDSQLDYWLRKHFQQFLARRKLIVQ